MNDEERLVEELQDFINNNPTDYNSCGCLVFVVIIIAVILAILGMISII